MARLCIELLGPWQVTLEGSRVTCFGYDKVRALLAYLAVESDRVHRREALAGMLWSDLPEVAAHNNLRQALAFLRRAIGDDVAPAPLLAVARDAIGLPPGKDWWLDVATCASLLRGAEEHCRQRPLCDLCAQRVRLAAALYRGDFLAGFSLARAAVFEQWALLARQEMQQRLIDALDRLITYHEARGEYHEAIGYVRWHLALDPWREESHRRLMQLLVCVGELSAALVQYARCRSALIQELGVEPAVETVRLYEQIQSARQQPSEDLRR